MNYEVSEKKGDSLVVSLTETEEGRYILSIDGRAIQVDAVRSGPTVYSIIEDGQQFEVMVDEKGAHGFDVMIGGRIFHLEALDERTRLLAGVRPGRSSPAGPAGAGARAPGRRSGCGGLPARRARRAIARPPARRGPRGMRAGVRLHFRAGATHTGQGTRSQRRRRNRRTRLRDSRGKTGGFFWPTVRAVPSTGPCWGLGAVTVRTRWLRTSQE